MSIRLHIVGCQIQMCLLKPAVLRQLFVNDYSKQVLGEMLWK